MSPALFAPGHQVGPYVVETYLTTGTFGAVYRARESVSQKIVALKVLDVPFGVRLGLDVFALGTHLLTLEHPHVLKVHDVYLNHHPAYVVMEYAKGGSLAEHFASLPSRIAPHEALALLTQVGEALSFLHERDIVHRGVQPSAILFSAPGYVHLAGLDLAIRVDQMSKSRPITTSRYCAPEEEEEGAPSVKSDQYALGCLTYHLFTGQRPSGQMHRHLARALLNQQIPEQVGRAVLRAVAELPDARWPTVEDFLVALHPSFPKHENHGGGSA